MQGVTSPGEPGQDVPGLQLALACGAAFYFARERRLSTGAYPGFLSAACRTASRCYMHPQQQRVRTSF